MERGHRWGDPIEVEAIKAVLGAPRERGATCVLGALKSNIGHLEAAAGVAGLIKVVLSMQNDKIPGNLHFRSLNPRIDLNGTSLEIAQTPRLGRLAFGRVMRVSARLESAGRTRTSSLKKYRGIWRNLFWRRNPPRICSLFLQKHPPLCVLMRKHTGNTGFRA
jgi:hypothetical protein